MAGHETTANTLSWASLLLSANPGARVELEADLRKVLDGSTPTLEDLTDLPYAEAVVKETLRLYPPAWTVYRVAEQDTEIGSYTIVAGTEVWTSQWVVHRDGRFFERPDAFVPERWLAGLEKSLPRYAYFPFGGGPRICIGNRFAAVEAALVLCTVSQRFRPRALADDVTPEPSMTLRPKGGVPVYLERSAWG